MYTFTKVFYDQSHHDVVIFFKFIVNNNDVNTVCVFYVHPAGK